MDYSLLWAKIKRFLCRVLIYQIVFLWSIIKINNIEKHTGEFKDKIIRNLNFFGVTDKGTLANFEDPSLVLFCLCVGEIVFGIFGVFGSFYGNFMSAILFAISTIIYFNPFLPENSVSLYNTRVELFYNTGIFLAILLCAFYPYEKKVSINSIDENSENDEDGDTPSEKVSIPQTNKTKKGRKIN